MRIPRYIELLAMEEQTDTRTRFDRADELVREQFSNLTKQDIILGAFPFGSVQVGDYGAMSDYDIAVEVADTSADEESIVLEAIHRAASAIYRQTKVPLEVSCFTTAQYSYGVHELPNGMLTWLKQQRSKQSNNIIGNDFVPSIASRRGCESSLTHNTVDRFASSTRHVLKKNWLQGVYFRPHDLLGLTLDAPHILGRKMDYRTRDASRAAIAAFVVDNFDDVTVGLYQEISTDAAMFQSELFLQQATALSEPEYDQIVEATLGDNLPKAIELVRRMQEAYRESHNIRFPMDRTPVFPYVERGTNTTAMEKDELLVQDYRMMQLDSY